MPERINGGLVLATLGALALLVSLFLTWYDPGRDAWTVFELNDLVLAALGLLALASSLPGLLGSPRLRFTPDASIPYAGVGALIIVTATLIQAPPSAAHGSPQFGAWFALGAAVAITLGGLLLRARVSVVITLRPRDRNRTSTVRVASRPEGRMPEPPPADPDTADEPYPHQDEYPEDDYPEEEPTETRPLADEERS
jgi:hypothetical protein